MVGHGRWVMVGGHGKGSDGRGSHGRWAMVGGILWGHGRGSHGMGSYGKGNHDRGIHDRGAPIGESWMGVHGWGSWKGLVASCSALY